MKVVIVEDEELAARQVVEFVQRYDGSIEIGAMISNCKSLRSWLQTEEEADLIFCDIELSDGNVLPVLSESRINSVLVFITAYEAYWSKALSLNGIDYLLKPVTEAKVHAALAKVAALKKVLNRDNNSTLR